MTVGERIKKLRTGLGLSQVDFADKINVSKQTLYKYENNIITNIPSDKIEAAARIGNISPAYLMGWEREISHLADKEASECVYKNSSNNFKQQKELNEIYLQLSVENQGRVVLYSKNLLSNQKMEERLLAAHKRTDIEQTAEGKKHDLDLMDDDKLWEE